MAKSLSKKIIALLEREHFMTVQEMLPRLRHNNKPYNKTSVYRALDNMVIDGRLMRQAFGTKEIFYRLRTDTQDYVVCSSCGQLSSLPKQKTAHVEIAGFQIDYAQTTYFGICQNCSNS